MNTNMHKNRFEVLDGIRGIAAIFVMVFHYTDNQFLVNSCLAVDVFFMLSGFVLYYSYADRLTAGMSIGEYFGRRIIRLYPLFFLGTLFGATILYFSASLTYIGCSPSIFTHSLIPNLFFIPTITNSTISPEKCEFAGLIFPSDGPLWSLFFELIASASLPLLIKIKNKSLLVLISICFSIITLAAIFAKIYDYTPQLDFNVGYEATSFLQGFPRVFYGFTIGVVAARSLKIFEVKPYLAILDRIKYKSLIVYGVLMLMLGIPLYIKYTYYLWAVIFICPLLVIIGASARCENPFISSCSEFLGWISYPLYCLHRPIFYGLKFLVLHNKIERPQVLIVTSIFLSIVLSIILTKIYDEPARKYLSKRLRYSFKHSIATSVTGGVLDTENSKIE